MFKCLLAAGGDFLTVTHDKFSEKLTVSIDQTKISTQVSLQLQASCSNCIFGDVLQM